MEIEQLQRENEELHKQAAQWKKEQQETLQLFKTPLPKTNPRRELWTKHTVDPQ